VGAVSLQMLSKFTFPEARLGYQLINLLVGQTDGEASLMVHLRWVGRLPGES